MGHLSKKILIRLIQSPEYVEKSAFTAKHIEKCPECGNNFAALKKIILPTDCRDIKPGRHVLKNISSYYDKISPIHNTAASKRDVNLPILRIRLAGGAALFAAASIIIYALYSHMQFENAPMKASKVRGVVQADKNNLRKGQSLHPGVLLTIGENSSLAIIYGKIVKLNAGPHTRIYITKSMIDKKTGKIYFELTVDKGIIIAVFDKSGNIEYTLKTPHGAVSSSGSTIAMKVDRSKTRVAVKDGSVNLSSSQGRSVSSEEGNAYTITSTGVTSSMDSSDEDEEDSSTLYENTAKDLLDDDPDDASV